MSGGTLIVYPPRGATFVPEDNILIGNVALYGATSGEAYFSGVAGERFAVRNSGALAVVEATGDHGCEYMTGGRVIVLGTTGRNFAAGMSGGIAYVWDEAGDFAQRCNLEMVGLVPLAEAEEIAAVRRLVQRHADYTGSQRARRLLAAWDAAVSKFIKVLPKDYQRVLLAMQRVQAAGLTGEQAVMAAFEENIHDVARIGGG